VERALAIREEDDGCGSQRAGGVGFFFAQRGVGATRVEGVLRRAMLEDESIV
jgi:hypothetical protein